MQISCLRMPTSNRFLSGIKWQEFVISFKSRSDIIFQKKKDTRGFQVSNVGVHAFAHGADLLTEVVCHPDFPKNRVHEVFDILGQLFKKNYHSFYRWWRLAFSQSTLWTILKGKLAQEQVSSWIKTVDFPIEEREDFYKFSNFKSCLLEVYVQLDQRNSLQYDLKEAIQSFQ